MIGRAQALDLASFDDLSAFLGRFVDRRAVVFSQLPTYYSASE